MKKIFFSFGTHEQPFQSLAEAVKKLAENPNYIITVQTGYTEFEVGRKNLILHEVLSNKEFLNLISESDVYISQVSPGNLFSGLTQGHIPIMWPRVESLREHVDNHQVQFGIQISQLQLASVVCNFEDLEREVTKYLETPRALIRQKTSEILVESSKRTFVFNSNLKDLIEKIVAG